YVNNGSLALTTAYNLQGSTYNVNYNATSNVFGLSINTSGTITTGSELPPLSYLFYRSGTVSVNNNFGAGVIQGASANINALGIAAGTTFDMNGKTLGIYTPNVTGNSGVMNASAATSTIVFNGTSAQNFTTGTLTNNYISNVTVTNTS